MYYLLIFQTNSVQGHKQDETQHWKNFNQHGPQRRILKGNEGHKINSQRFEERHQLWPHTFQLQIIFYNLIMHH